MSGRECYHCKQWVQEGEPPESQTKLAHFVQIRHRDEIESPITDWLREAFDRSDAPRAKGETTEQK